MKKYKSVYLYKTGRFQEDFEYLFPNIKVKKYITDDNRKNYKGKECINIKKLTNDINKMIVVCDRKSDALIKRLRSYGLIENVNYIFFEDFGVLLDEKIFNIIEKLIYNHFNKKNIYYPKFRTNSELLKKMIYTDSTHNLNCQEPFNHIQIDAQYIAHPCCPGFLEENFGNLIFHSAKKIWNSNKAKLIRLSIINKTYAFCNLNYCRLSETDINKNKARNNDLEVSKIPEYTVIGIDESCNLKCKSCRCNRINNNNNMLKQLNYNNIIKKIYKAGWFNKTKHLILATQGEVFFSKVYKKILFSNKLKNLDTLVIHTNGILLNKNNLDKLCNQLVLNNIKCLTMNISVDSIDEETYAKLRPGGNVKILKRNIEYISQARREGKIYNISLVMVLQKDNYKELPAIAKFAIDMNFDRLDVQTITDWGTYSKEEFEEICMFDKNGNPKPELQEILKDPIFKSKDIKFVGNVFKSETYI